MEAGAPEGVIQCLTQPTLESTQALMRHQRTAVILATGGSGMVRAAYSSGKPAFGVGPGNVPVLLDRSADVSEAVAKVVQGKSFDYGTVCSSEQSLVAEESLREPILAALRAARAHLCDEPQREALAKLLITPAGSINAKCVGQPASRIAEMAGFQVPPDTPILAVEIQGVGRAHPLSAEKLSPVLSLLFVRDFEAALDACEAVLRFGGLGHTSVIHARDEARIHEYARRMPAMRVMVNTPSPQGSVGITTNLLPSMTLGCGAAGGNSTSDNVGPLHLINIKRLAYAVRRPEDAFQIPAAGPAHATPTDIVDRFLASRQGRRTAEVAAECAMQPPLDGRRSGAAPGAPQDCSSGSRNRRFRLRERCAGRPARLAQDLHRTAVDRNAIGSRSGRPARYPDPGTTPMKPNLDTLKESMLEQLQAQGFAVFHGLCRHGESHPMAWWDTRRQPEFRDVPSRRA